MNSSGASSSGAGAIRRRAEERLRQVQGGTDEILTREEALVLLHELRVHQIELQMQNEELQGVHEELERARQRYYELFDFAPVGYLTLDENGIILEINLTGTSLLRAKRQHIVQRRLSEFIDPADRDAFFGHLLAVKQTEDPQVVELRLRTPGEAPFWARLECSPGLDVSSGQACVRCVFGDISESRRLEEERRKMTEVNARSQRLEAIGRLAGGVAHEFNNMLCVMLGHADLALAAPSGDETSRTHLLEIRAAAERSARLTRQLLAFARRQTIAPRVVDLNDVVTGALDMLPHLLGERIHLVWTPSDGLWPVRIDENQLDQILTNLTLNARDAIPGHGRIEIETHNLTVSPASPERHGGVPNGDFVVLAVTDSGTGMTPEVAASVFEPFFTTKPHGRGTGLGLAMVHGSVQQNHGTITVDSTPGRGTTFRIYLPRAHGPVARRGTTTPVTVATNGEERLVLIVEDEPSVLQMCDSMLRALGYRVLTARTPSEALDHAGRHPRSLRLLVSDVIMPEMSGPELGRRIQTLCPNLPTLYISGHTADVVARAGAFADGFAFLQKPFTSAELGARIATLMATPLKTAPR